MSSAPDLPPTIIGAAGLTGRQAIVRTPELERDEDGIPQASPPSKAIPPSCLRVLYSPLPVDRGGGCQTDCPGLQRGGGCLCDVVRAANEAGVDWAFEVVPVGDTVEWVYAGEPIPEAT